MAWRANAKLTAICLCILLAVPAHFSSASLASGRRIMKSNLRALVKSHSEHSFKTRNLLQNSSTSSTSSNLDPSVEEVAYCFPYFYVYGFYGDAYTKCLDIVQGEITGTGEVEDECIDTLIPLYETFTEAQFSTAISQYNRCLFSTGYTLTDSAQEAIQSSTIPAITERMGPGTAAYDEYLAENGLSDSSSSDSTSTSTSGTSSSDSSSSSLSGSNTPVTVETNSGTSIVNPNTGSIAGLTVPDWGRRL